MYRSDGYRVLSTDPIYQIVPHIMPKRYDASNSIKVDIDLEPIQNYIKECRKKGISVSHMSVIIAGYLRIVSQNPYLNRFVMNKKIYSRNHFCVSFVTLTPGSETDTVSKLYFNLDDTLPVVNEKIAAAIERVRNHGGPNSMDKLIAKLCRTPFLLTFSIGFLKLLDRFFTLPFSIVDASPFHTSLFVTNLASIRTNTIYHHLYEFGTTGVFVSMGQPMKKPRLNGETFEEKKVMELGIVTDERIANGHYYGRCFKELSKYYKNPALLETPPESVVSDPDVKKKKRKWIVK
mgnify:CR=1 FL=1